MEFFDAGKSIVENMFYLCAPIALLAALIGLYQIKVAKDSISINSKRNAMSFSFKICEDYMPKLLDIADELVKELKVLKIDYEKLQYKPISNFRDLKEDHFEEKQLKLITQNYNKIDLGFHKLIELLESFSLPFVCGLADEELGFNIDSLKFIELYQMCAPFFFFNKEELKKDIDIYKNSSDLYKQWSNRTDGDLIDNKMRKLSEKRNGLSVITIKPVGVE